MPCSEILYRSLRGILISALPFCTDRHKIFSDPRLGFNKTDSIVGIVLTEKKPDVQLIRFDDESDVVEISYIEKQGNCYAFKHSLADLRSSHYHLMVKHESVEIYRKIIVVLSLIIEKPKKFFRVEKYRSPLS